MKSQSSIRNYFTVTEFKQIFFLIETICPFQSCAFVHIFY